MKFSTFAVTLTLNTAIQHSHWTLQLIFDHLTRFGCNQILSSKDIEKSHSLSRSLHCDCSEDRVKKTKVIV